MGRWSLPVFKTDDLIAKKKILLKEPNLPNSFLIEKKVLDAALLSLLFMKSKLCVFHWTLKVRVNSVFSYKHIYA